MSLHTTEGKAKLSVAEHGISMLDFVDDVHPIDPGRTPLPHATFERDHRGAERIAELAFGDRRELQRLRVHGTNFQLRVWNALLAMDRGERTSYARLAGAIGEPKAARAVGNALAVNPVAILIPCHRVIASSGAVGNYKWGQRRKRALLAWGSAATMPADPAAVTSSSRSARTR